MMCVGVGAPMRKPYSFLIQFKRISVTVVLFATWLNPSGFQGNLGNIWVLLST